MASSHAAKSGAVGVSSLRSIRRTDFCCAIRAPSNNGLWRELLINSGSEQERILNEEPVLGHSYDLGQKTTTRKGNCTIFSIRRRYRNEAGNLRYGPKGFPFGGFRARRQAFGHKIC